jgi:tetratricopeptide (TPR) repeat protein
MVGRRLRRLRLDRGLTQTQLARPRYTHAYVSAIESGRQAPSSQALEYFAGRLGVPVDELKTGRKPGAEARLELRLQEALVGLSSGQTREAKSELESMAKEARRASLPRIQARAEEGLGLLLERQEKPEEALEHYRTAADLLADEPPTAIVDAVAGKARCFHSLGDVRYEIHILETLLGEMERAELLDPNALARVHAGLVYAYVEAGLYAKAAESAAELERIAPMVTDPLRVAQMHLHVARLYLVQGRVREAEISLQRSEDSYRQANLRTETGYAHLALGYVFSREGRIDDARRELHEAMRIFEDVADTKDLTRTLNELARLERLQGRADQARTLLERSISLTGDSDTPILAWAHRELGIVLTPFDGRGAEKNLRVAIDMYERAEQTFDVAVTYRALGELLESQGDHKGGCDAYRTGIMALEPHL